jgi:hypothetical protein
MASVKPRRNRRSALSCKTASTTCKRGDPWTSKCSYDARLNSKDHAASDNDKRTSLHDDDSYVMIVMMIGS